MPRVKPETRERVRRTIELATLTLLSSRGYEATGMRDVAKEAGMSPAALYNHYESKDALFAALVERYQGRVTDMSDDNPLRRYMETNQFPYDLEQLAWALEAVVERDKQYLVLWYVDLIHFGGRHFRNQLAPTLLMQTPALKKRLAALNKSGELRNDPDTLFKMAYVHFFNFFLVVHVFDGGSFFGGDRAKKKSVRTIVDTFLYGMVDERPETS